MTCECGGVCVMVLMCLCHVCHTPYDYRVRRMPVGPVAGNRICYEAGRSRMQVSCSGRCAPYAGEPIAT